MGCSRPTDRYNKSHIGFASAQQFLGSTARRLLVEELVGIIATHDVIPGYWHLMYSFGGEKYEDRKGSRNRNISRAKGILQIPGVEALVTSVSSIKTKSRTDFSPYSEIKPQR